jgi:hypothetical protein
MGPAARPRWSWPLVGIISAQLASEVAISSLDALLVLRARSSHSLERRRTERGGSSGQQRVSGRLIIMTTDLTLRVSHNGARLEFHC